MDEQAQGLLATLKKSSVAIDTKLAAFSNIKSSIKHQRVPESSQPVLFECIKIGIAAQTSPTLVSTAISTLGHLVKRLSLQEQGNVVTAYAPKLLPLVQERLGEPRENLRNAASQTMCDLWPFAKEQVERVIRDGALVGSNARAKEAAMMWIVKVHRTDGLQFKSFVPNLVASLEDPDGGVRETAKSCIVELFGSAPERAKNDLRKQMVAHDVRRAIMSFVMQHLGMENSTELDLGASATASSAKAHGGHHGALNESALSEQSSHNDNPAPDPLYVHSARELEETFRDMASPFEGKETEHNWMARDKNITKMRRMLQGNAPSDFLTTFVAGVKGMLDNIIKFTNTLRTTPSTNACHLCQELYRVLGNSMDSMTELMIQNFVKMSAATKQITAKQADATMETILSNCSYGSRIMQHIWMSFGEKNMQTRSFAPGWLKVIMKKGASHRSHIEHAGGIEMIEKCLKKGLEDASPKVRESTRSAYWTYAQIWHSQADRFMEHLDDKMRQALEKDPNNPNKTSLASSVSSITSTKSRSGATTRPSVRDAIAAQRRAALQKNLPERPNSAQSAFASTETPTSSRNPIRGAPVKSSALAKPHEAQAPSSTRPTVAAPVRRPKKPDVLRPATADPYAGRNNDLKRETTPTISPHVSPAKSNTGMKATAASALRVGSKTPARTPATTTPAIRGKVRADTATRPTPKQVGHSRINSLPISPTPKEDNLTLVLPTRTKATIPATAPVLKHDFSRRPRDSDATIDSEADSETFTMVLPTLQHNDVAASSSRPTSRGTPTKSSIPVRSPRRGANENLKPESPLAKHFDVASKSKSPERPRIADLDQADSKAIQVYEDPFQEDDLSTAPTKPPKTVLEEIVINEKPADSGTNVHTELSQSTRSNEQNADGPRAPRDQLKPVTSNGSSANGDMIDQPPTTEALKSRRLLTSAIERIRAKSLDAHGFRRVQEIIKTKQDIWGENAVKFGELMDALLEYLETPADLLKTPGASAGSKIQNLKTQVLATVRAMLALHPKQAGPFYTRSLRSILTARSQFDDMSHIASEMERTSEEISRSGPASECLDAVLNLVNSLLKTSRPSTPSSPATSPASRHRSSSSDAAHNPRTISLSLQTLATLLSALSARKAAPSPIQVKQLGGVAVSLLQDTDPEVRRADMEFCLVLHERLEERAFWKAVEGAKESGLNLITYYLARRDRAAATQTAAVA